MPVVVVVVGAGGVCVCVWQFGSMAKLVFIMLNRTEQRCVIPAAHNAEAATATQLNITLVPSSSLGNGGKSLLIDKTRKGHMNRANGRALVGEMSQDRTHMLGTWTCNGGGVRRQQ